MLNKTYEFDDFESMLLQKLNNLMIFKQVLFDDFHLMHLQDLKNTERKKKTQKESEGERNRKTKDRC